jgi:putative oxidoreductase
MTGNFKARSEIMNAVEDRSAQTMRNMKTYLLPLARVLMSSLFIWDGVLQLRNPAGTAQYFASVHVPVPDASVWVSIAVHLLGGLALLLGFQTRWAAVVLILLCLGTAFGVHLPVGDQANMINFYKNLVMAGGLLYVVAYGAGSISVDKESE